MELELDEVCLQLILTLIKTFHDPKLADLWTADGKGLDSLHLAIFAGLLPPEVLEQPAKYRPQLRSIIDKLRHLESLALIAPTQGYSIQDGVRPTEAGIARIAHVSQSRLPWWRALLNRFK